MSPEQIADERRRGRLAAAAAVIAAAMFAASAIWSQSLSGDAPERNGPALLRFFDRHIGELVGSSTLRGVALLLLLPVTIHLYRATKARRVEEPQVVLAMGIYGPAAAGIGTIVVAVALASAASSFTDRQFQTIHAADDAFRTVQLLGLLSFSGSLALAFWFVKGCLDAIRIGLMSRFMGVVGIILGPGLVVLSAVFQFLLPVWLVAVAGLYAGYTFGAKPPAWDAGEAVALPTARERFGDTLDDRALPAAPNGEVDAVGPGVRQGDGDPGAPRKRKRKRRA
jgi:hypothetical protein